jgi:hypothetical protein
MMQYLGYLRGGGILVAGAVEFGRVDFDLDGYLTRPGEVIASGEIRMASEGLNAAFGRNDLKLQTDDGLTLELRFSDKRIGPTSEAAHVDIKSGLPEAKKWRR